MAGYTGPRAATVTLLSPSPVVAPHTAWCKLTFVVYHVRCSFFASMPGLFNNPSKMRLF